MKKVLVIVVTYNGLHWLERCLRSVAGDPSASLGMTEGGGGPSASLGMTGGAGDPSASLGMTTDVYVWDNDSTDGSADYVAAHFPQAHLVRSADNVGFSKANNMGFEWAIKKGYDYVYLLNQDAWLAPGALETLVAAAEAHPDFAVLSPLQCQDGYIELDAQFGKRYTRALRALGMTKKSTSVIPTKKSTSVIMTKNSTSVIPSEASVSPIIPLHTVMAAHWLVPVGALKAIGLFEEELFPFYGQDDDWCNRARHLGYKVGIVPEAKAVHDRARRQEAKEKVIHRNYYTGSLVRLCNVNCPLWERFLFVCLFTLVKALKYRSLLPFKHFLTICGQISQIKTYRKSVRSHAKPE